MGVFSVSTDRHNHGVKNSASQQADEKTWTWQFACIVFITYLSMSALTYTRVCLNSPSELIKDFMNATNIERTGEPMTSSEMESLFGLLQAVIGVGAAFGAFTASSMADSLGRKLAIFLSSGAGAVGTLIMAIAETAKTYELLFLGRAVMGLGAGWIFSMAPAYVAEICRPNMKAVAVVLNMVFQGSAMFFAQVLGYEELLGNEEYWSVLIGLPVVILAVHMFFLMFCPESPRYLLMKKSDDEGARKALRTIRGTEDVQRDIDMLHAELAESSVKAQVSTIGLFRSPFLRKPLIIAIVMGLTQNWGGMNAIMFFSTSLFEDAGISVKESRYATSGIGAMFFISNIATLVITPRFGRKTIFVMGTIGMGACSAILAVSMAYKDEVEALKYINVCISLLIIAFYALGPISVFWAINSEIFPHSARSAGYGLGFTCAFTGFFAHCYLFPEMLKAMQSYTFFVFTAVDILMAAFVIVYIPETKDKSFAEIAATWTNTQEIRNYQSNEDDQPEWVVSSREQETKGSIEYSIEGSIEGSTKAGMGERSSDKIDGIYPRELLP